MSHEIKDTLSAFIKIEMTPALANAVIRFVNAYESRGTHPEAFNSPFLGLYPCFFLTKDRDDFFAIFDVDNKEITSHISKHSNGHNTIFGITTRSLMDSFRGMLDNLRRSMVIQGITASDVRRMVNDITSIDSNFKVASDPLTIFVRSEEHT